MSPGFPRERGAKRAHLLAAVEGIREVVAAGALEAERLGTLPPATVRALAGSGLVALKVPESLGGAEADPVRRGMTTIGASLSLSRRAARPSNDIPLRKTGELKRVLSI